MGKLKKSILLVSLLAVFCLGANPYGKTRLTVTNKSGMKIAVQLLGTETEEFYYLTIPNGDQRIPVTKTFTIERDLYSAQIFYIETYDPVYGFQCSAVSTQLNGTKNSWILVKECGPGSVKTNKPEKQRIKGLPFAI